MKPDWEDAPWWAKFLSQDYDGSWWWFEVKPTADGLRWTDIFGRAEPAFKANNDDWEETLEERPQ